MNRWVERDLYGFIEKIIILQNCGEVLYSIGSLICFRICQINVYFHEYKVQFTLWIRSNRVTSSKHNNQMYCLKKSRMFAFFFSISIRQTFHFFHFISSHFTFIFSVLLLFFFNNSNCSNLAKYEWKISYYAC